MIVFDHIAGAVRYTTAEDERQRAARVELALRRIFEEAACFRTNEAERVLCEVFDIAQAALAPDG